MKIYDITVTVTPELPVWPGDPSVVLEPISKIEEGGSSNVSRLETSVHAGTHVDAPHHFVTGTGTIESLPLDVLVGEAQVVELPPEVDLITADVLKNAGIQDGAQRVLFKTRNSQYWVRQEKTFQKDFVALSPDAASFLVERGVRLVGIDYLSIAPFSEGRLTHEILLKAKLVILEGTNLSEVPAGQYELCCLPLKLGGSDGAPTRAILIQR